MVGHDALDVGIQVRILVSQTGFLEKLVRGENPGPPAKLAVCPEQNPNFFSKQSKRGLICTPRPLPSVAGAKTKNVPYLSYFPRRGVGRSRQKKMERKFFILLRR